MKPHILVVGDAIDDRYVFFKTVRRHIESGLPIVNGVERRRYPGGASAVAAMARQLGAEVTLVGWASGRPMPTKVRYVLDGITLFRGDSEITRPIEADKVDELLCGVDWDAIDIVVISDYAKGMVTPEMLKAVFERSREAGCRVIIDPSRTLDPRTCLDAWLVISNAGQAEWRNFTRLIAKLGKNGMILSDGTRIMELSSSCRTLVDDCGAGDQVAATVAVWLAGGASLEESAVAASAAAGLKCERFGTYGPTREAVEGRLTEIYHGAEKLGC